ncbi:isoprenoid synthase domain-containing protein [Infundibulicybe gibba]|nr:isoprenoid synthase domain-containing protein [Infundibulicybe gibba]
MPLLELQVKHLHSLKSACRPSTIVSKVHYAQESISSGTHRETRSHRWQKCKDLSTEYLESRYLDNSANLNRAGLISRHIYTDQDRELDDSAQSKHQTPPAGITDAYRDSIRGVLVRFLKELDIPFSTPQYDHQFAQEACDEALRLGYHPAHFYSPEFQRGLQPAAAICMTTYPHLSIAVRYYICIFTTSMIYLDDLAMKDIAIIKEFNVSFLQNKKQIHPFLDSLAVLLRTTYDHFNEYNASMIVTGTLEYISSLIMEQGQQGMVVHTAATNYPGYLRYITGNSRPYALFFFPRDIPLEAYVQIIPDIINYSNDVNDIFSFYKEELAGETNNQICLLAKLRGCTKLEAMEHLAQVSIDGARRIATVLESHPEARALARKYFVEGYVAFHALSRERVVWIYCNERKLVLLWPKTLCI